MSKQAEVVAAFQKVVDHFGDLNVVVNNAGVAPTTPLDTITEEQFNRTFAINVGGVIWEHKLLKLNSSTWSRW